MKRILLLLASLLGLCGNLWAAPVRDGAVSVELLSEDASVEPGHPFWVAVKLDMEKHWHTYFKNPGDSGLKTKVTWDLPPGFMAEPPLWPVPKRIDEPPFTSYGYEGTEYLLFRILPPPSFNGEKSVVLKAAINWLMCKEACIPGQATVSMTLPTAKKGQVQPSVHTQAFADARAALPESKLNWNVTLSSDASNIRVEIEAADIPVGITNLYFFPETEVVIEHAERQTFEQKGQKLIFNMTRAAVAKELPKFFHGVLVYQTPAGSGAARFRAPQSAGANAQLNAPLMDVASGTSPELAHWFFLALLGGLILNLMPCVFPVLSLKVLGFVQESKASPMEILEKGFMFTAGVLVSFWTLAGALMFLRQGGEQIGWGFQLQNPQVIICLALLFFGLALNLFGVFEIGTSLTSAGGKAANKSGMMGAFFSGLLATLVATPCSAPFMGAAIGAAMTQTPVNAMIIFTGVGLGMALPYLLLCAFPGVLKALPKPGAWMESLKQFFGFMMVATSIWLLWVLDKQTGSSGILIALVACLMLGVAGWIYGRWGALYRPLWVRIVAMLLALPLAGAAVYGSVVLILPLSMPTDALSAEDEFWHTYNADKLEELRAAGKPVFVDFTASWCLTCQVNKRIALHRPETLDLFKAKGVYLMKADWTDRDPEITKALTALSRTAVPVYALYKGGPKEDPQLLPEVLTPAIVFDALNALP